VVLKTYLIIHSTVNQQSINNQSINLPTHLPIHPSFFATSSIQSLPINISLLALHVYYHLKHFKMRFSVASVFLCAALVNAVALPAPAPAPKAGDVNKSIPKAKTSTLSGTKV